MFERYTEQARRAIFFARYEASQYGSPKIDTEHLLLGTLRTDSRLTRALFDDIGSAGSIRKEIEAQTERGPVISTSVEMPLSTESKRVLDLAADSAEKLGHRYVDTVHLILGMLRVEGCLAARILNSRSVDAKKVEQKIAAHNPGVALGSVDLRPVGNPEEWRSDIRSTGAQLVDTWTTRDASRFADLFAVGGNFWDSCGRRWSGPDIQKTTEAYFQSHNPEGLQVSLENILQVTPHAAVATLSMVAAKSRQQLVVVFYNVGRTWQIVSAHFSLLEASPSSANPPEAQ